MSHPPSDLSPEQQLQRWEAHLGIGNPPPALSAVSPLLDVALRDGHAEASEEGTTPLRLGRLALMAIGHRLSAATSLPDVDWLAQATDTARRLREAHFDPRAVTLVTCELARHIAGRPDLFLPAPSEEIIAALDADDLEASAEESSGHTEGLLNINEASPSDLHAIPGLGLKRVRWIVKSRQKGFFKDLGQLEALPGIGPKTLKKLNSYIYVAPPGIASDVGWEDLVPKITALIQVTLAELEVAVGSTNRAHQSEAKGAAQLLQAWLMADARPWLLSHSGSPDARDALLDGARKLEALTGYSWTGRLKQARD